MKDKNNEAEYEIIDQDYIHKLYLAVKELISGEKLKILNLDKEIIDKKNLGYAIYFKFLRLLFCLRFSLEKTSDLIQPNFIVDQAKTSDARNEVIGAFCAFFSFSFLISLFSLFEDFICCTFLGFKKNPLLRNKIEKKFHKKFKELYLSDKFDYIAEISSFTSCDIDLLKLLSSIRNSVHSNLFHNKKAFCSIKYKIIFNKNKPIEGLSIRKTIELTKDFLMLKDKISKHIIPFNFEDNTVLIDQEQV